AGADIAAGGAEIAAVAADHRRMAAFRAGPAENRPGRGLDGPDLAQERRARDRIALAVEDAEHLVAVDQEPGDIGHRRGLHRLFLPARDACEEVPLRLGMVLEAAELLADPGR